MPSDFRPFVLDKGLQEKDGKCWSMEDAAHTHGVPHTKCTHSFFPTASKIYWQEKLHEQFLEMDTRWVAEHQIEQVSDTTESETK